MRRHRDEPDPPGGRAARRLSQFQEARSSPAETVSKPDDAESPPADAEDPGKDDDTEGGDAAEDR